MSSSLKLNAQISKTRNPPEPVVPVTPVSTSPSVTKKAHKKVPSYLQGTTSSSFKVDPPRPQTASKKKQPPKFSQQAKKPVIKEEPPSVLISKYLNKQKTLTDKLESKLTSQQTLKKESEPKLVSQSTLKKNSTEPKFVS